MIRISIAPCTFCYCFTQNLNEILPNSKPITGSKLTSRKDKHRLTSLRDISRPNFPRAMLQMRYLAIDVPCVTSWTRYLACSTLGERGWLEILGYILQQVLTIFFLLSLDFFTNFCQYIYYEFLFAVLCVIRYSFILKKNNFFNGEL